MTLAVPRHAPPLLVGGQRGAEEEKKKKKKAERGKIFRQKIQHPSHSFPFPLFLPFGHICRSRGLAKFFVNDLLIFISILDTPFWITLFIANMVEKVYLSYNDVSTPEPRPVPPLQPPPPPCDAFEMRQP